MFEHLQYQNQNSFPPQEGAIDSVKLLREILEAFSKVENRVRTLKEAIGSNDKQHMWNVLQQYLAEYHDLINQWSPFTNVTVTRADAGTDFRNLGTEAIRARLQWLLNFIYATDAIGFATDERAKHCVKQLLQNSGFSCPW